MRSLGPLLLTVSYGSEPDQTLLLCRPKPCCTCLWCREGVYDAIPVYDKHAQRYIIIAVCSGKGAVLLAASATSDPSKSWFLFNLVADAADTGMACAGPVETALAESVRVTYNTDGLYLSL